MALPYPNLVFTPLDILTAEEMNEIVANYTYVHNNAHPIGSIFMSVTMTTAAQVEAALGGTWVAWGKGRVPVGVDTGQTEFDTVEKTSGEKTHTLTTDEMPSHKHDVTVVSDTYGGGTRTQSYQVGLGDLQTQPLLSAKPVGGGQAHNNLQPYITCYMYKRTA